jgi:ribosome-binding factor A
MSIRTEKVGSVVKRALVNPVQNLAKEFGAGLASVTIVRLSKDLSIAKVYVSVYGGKSMTPTAFIELLEKKKGEIRYRLAGEVELRFLPELRFFIDDTFDQMEHIQKLIDNAKAAYPVKTEKEDDSQ